MTTPRVLLPILALLPLSLSGDPAAVHRRLEVACLQARFDSVDAELRGRVGVPPPTGLALRTAF
jgi:hypothetical protein